MPYVRQHGRQIELVHGVRNAKGKVEQRVLFTLHSKPEALDAIGKSAHLFKSLIEAQYPDLTFGWPKLKRAVEQNLHVLPDSYEYANERVRDNFRKTLCAFAAQLAHADPQSLLSAAEVIRTHRHELEWLHDLIKWRLKLSNAKPNERGQDNEYCWRYVLRGSDVPMDAIEHAEALYQKGELERAAALFRLFLDAFGEDPDAHNYLGLIALEQDRVQDAIAEFRKTIDSGRRSCPKRISKKMFQEDHRARPYLRGLTNLASALNLAGKYDEALDVLDKLDKECGDDLTANSTRAIIYLNLQRWKEAAEAARSFTIWPAESLTASIALFELGRHLDAAVHVLHAAINLPRASRMLHGLHPDKAKTSTEAEDWNEGVHLDKHLHAYHAKRSRTSKNFFRSLLAHPRLVALQRQAEDAESVWRDTKTRAGFDTMNRLRSFEFARQEGPKLLVGSARRPGTHGA